jgi:hypothetical protein
MLTALRWLALVQNVVSSVAMGIYMQRTLVGSFLFFSDNNPPTFNGNMITYWVATPMLIYLLSQASAIAFRPPGSIYLVAVGWLSSLYPLFEISAATFKPGLMPFQYDAWWLWTWGEGIDLVCIFISFRLLQRSFYGDVQHGHPGI